MKTVRSSLPTYPWFLLKSASYAIVGLSYAIRRINRLIASLFLEGVTRSRFQ